MRGPSCGNEIIVNQPYYYLNNKPGLFVVPVCLHMFWHKVGETIIIIIIIIIIIQIIIGRVNFFGWFWVGGEGGGLLLFK